MVKRQRTVSGRLWVCFYCFRKSCRAMITMIDTMQQMASDINKMRRSLSIDAPIVNRLRLQVLQGTSCKRTPKIGSALQIRRKTTTLGVKSIETEPAHGFSKRASSIGGTRRDPFCGSMENVCSQPKHYVGPNSFRIM